MIHRLPIWIILGSVLLALNAGFINSVALLSFANNAVSHVTGTATIAADALVRGHWQTLANTGLIVICFLLGAIISGAIVGNEALRMGRRYGIALLLESILLALAWYGFRQGAFYAELCASAACGLQNAMVATYSGSVIRTTHLTGIVSDIGSTLGNFFAGRGLLKTQLKLQSAILFAFLGGAAVGSVVFQYWHYHAVLLSSLWVLFVAGVYVIYSQKNRYSAQ